MTKKPRVAMVHVADDHGVSRYGDRLSGFLLEHGRMEVQPTPAQRTLWSLPQEVRGWLRADVLHVQWSPLYWGEGWGVVARAALLAVVGLRRPVIVTMHDVHHERWQAGNQSPVPTPRSGRLVRLTGAGRRFRLRARPTNLAQLIVLRTVDEVLVFSPEEASVLARRRTRSVRVVPHFIEEWQEPDGPAEETRLVVFGFIHPRKGQLLAVEALADLPDLELVLCGAAEPKHQDYLETILARARELGVRDRVTVTGRVDDADLAGVLGSSRLALCPYQRIAASGSMSTLIAHGLPIVAHSTAYSRRLAEAAPQAITLFAPWTARGLAVQIRQALGHVPDGQREQLRDLAKRDGPGPTAARHEARFVHALSRKGRHD